MTNEKQKRLEDLQWKAGNHKIDAGEEAEMRRLTEELAESRNQPLGDEAGVIGDKNQDGEPDGQKQTGREDRDRESAQNTAPKAGKGVTTTQNVNG